MPNTNRTILLVEQNARPGLDLSTQGVVMESGRMRLEGTHKEITARVENWDDWCREWCATGDVHHAPATEAEAKGSAISAGEAYIAAALGHHLLFADRRQSRRPELEEDVSRNPFGKHASSQNQMRLHVSRNSLDTC